MAQSLGTLELQLTANSAQLKREMQLSQQLATVAAEAMAKELAKSFDLAANQIRGKKQTMSSAIADALSGDFSGIGRKIGDGVSGAIHASIKASGSVMRNAIEGVFKSAMGGLQNIFMGVFQGIGQSIYGAISTPIMNAFRGLTDMSSYMKFDGAKSGIAALGADANQVAEDAKKASKELGYLKSQADMVKASYDVISSGFSGKDAMTVVKASAKASVAAKDKSGNTADLDIVGDAATTILNSYKMGAKDAEKVTAQMVGTVNAGKISLQDYSSLIGRTASIASAAGVSLEDLNVAIAASTVSGVRASSAIDGMRAALSSMAKPSQDAAEYADEIGVDFSVAAVQSKGFLNVLREIQAAGAANPEGITRLFGSVEAWTALQPVFDKLKTGIEDIQKTVTGVNMDKIFKDGQGSAQQMVGQLKVLQEELDLKLKTSLAPIFTAGTQALTKLVQKLVETDGLFDGLKKQADKFAQYLEQNPQLIDQLYEVVRNLIDQGVNVLVNLSQQLLEYLQKNPNALQDAVRMTGDFLTTMKDLVVASKPLADIFIGIVDMIGKAIQGLNYMKLALQAIMSGQGLGGAMSAVQGQWNQDNGIGGAGGGAPTGEQLVGAVLSILEAGPGDKQGQVDVAQVITNRVGNNFDGKGRSIREQAFADMQFQPFFSEADGGYGIGKNDIQDQSSAVAALVKALKVSPEEASKLLAEFFSSVRNQQMAQNASDTIGSRSYFLGVGMGRENAADVVQRNGQSNFFFNARSDTTGNNYQAYGIGSLFGTGGGGGGSQGGAGGSMGEAFASGLYTAPQSRNGGSAEYHIDTKFNKSMSTEARVAAMDAMARAYAAQGRKIEFSNNAVAGAVYNPDDPNRTNLLKQAQEAHSHSTYGEWDSVDYYIPSKDANRFHSSAENAEMLLPKLPGGRVEYGSGGRYGNYALLYDANGNLVMKTGHGDDGRAVPAGKSFGAAGSQGAVQEERAETQEEAFKRLGISGNGAVTTKSGEAIVPPTPKPRAATESAIEAARKLVEPAEQERREQSNKMTELNDQNAMEVMKQGIADAPDSESRAIAERSMQRLEIEQKYNAKINELLQDREDLEAAREKKVKTKKTGGPDYSAAIKDIDALVAANKKLQDQELKTIETESKSGDRRDELAKERQRRDAEIEASQKRQLLELQKLQAQESNPIKKQDIADRIETAQIEFDTENAKRPLQDQLEDLMKSREYLVKIKADPEAIKKLDAQIKSVSQGLLDAAQQGSERLEILSARLAETQKQRDRELKADTAAFGSIMSSSTTGRMKATAGLMNAGYDSFGAAALQKEAAIMEEQNRYRNELLDIEKRVYELRQKGVNISAMDVAQLKINAKAVNEINLKGIDQQFKSLGKTIEDTAKKSFGTFLTDILTGSKSVGDAFRGLVSNILGQLAQLAVNSLFMNLFGGGITGGLGKKPGGGLGSGVGGLITKVLGFKNGGDVPSLSGNSFRSGYGAISEALRREGPNSVLAALTPREKVLDVNEAMAYRKLFPNGIGSIANFSAGGDVGGAIAAGIQPMKTTGGSPISITVPVTVGSDSNVDPKKLSEIIQASLNDILLKQQRPGGSLYNR